MTDFFVPIVGQSGTTNIILNIDGTYQLLVMTNNVAVTNVNWVNNIYVTLMLSNSTATSTNFYWVTGGRAIGSTTTNALAVGAGKTAFVSVIGISGNITNYCNAAQQ